MKTFKNVQLLPMLINSEKNPEKLQGLVSRPFLDLKIAIQMKLDVDETGTEMAIPLKKAMVKDMEEDVLFQMAFRNLQKEGIIELTLDNICGEDEISREMCVVLVESWCVGASVLLRNDVLRKIAEKYQSGFYILPSSIYEIITVKPEGWDNEVEELKKMIAEVNDECVTKEEQLSENLYYYDWDNGRVEIIGKEKSNNIRSKISNDIGDIKIQQEL